MNGSPTLKITLAGSQVAAISAVQVGDKNNLKSLLPMLRDIKSQANEQLTQLAAKEVTAHDLGDGVQTMEEEQEDDDDDDEHSTDAEKRKVLEKTHSFQKDESVKKKRVH